MKLIRPAIIFVGIAGVSLAHSAPPLIPDYILATQRGVIYQWVMQNPDYKIALDSDCGCPEDLRRIRTVTDGVWEAQPDYHPYYSLGDFNGDGKIDVAVGAIKHNDPSHFRVVLFHGPLSETSGAKAYFLSEPFPLGQGMFFGPPRPQPWRLVVGPFESEGAVLQPSSTGYRWDASGE